MEIIREISRWIYRQKLPHIELFIALLVLLWMIGEMCFGDKKRWRCWNGVVFAGAVTVILYLTVWSRGYSPHGVYLVPFRSFVRAKVQREIYRVLLMNVFLFVPIGLSMPRILPTKWKRRALPTVLFGMLLSIAVEWCQYQFRLGRCEVDDVIMNTFGTFIGTLSFTVPRLRRKDKTP